MPAEFRRTVPIGTVVAKQRAAMGRGVKIVGEMLRRDANETAPLDTGELRRSARVSFEGSNAKAARATVRYGAPHAIYVHERPGLHYQGAGRYKWLQLTAEEQREKYGRVIADQLRDIN